MKFGNKTFTGLSASLLLFSLFTFSIPVNAFSGGDYGVQKLFSLPESPLNKIVEKNKQLLDEASAYISESSADKLVVQVWKNGQMIGTSSFQKHGDILTYKFTAGSDFFLAFQVNNQLLRKGFRNSEIATIQTNNTKVGFTTSQFVSGKKLTGTQLTLLQKINSETVNQKDLSEVIKTTARIRELRLIGGGLACTGAITDCIVAAAEYLGSIGALIALCGETLGLSCVGAILLHPVLALHVGTECGKVDAACKDAPAVDVPVG
jgi:hypothetical protein